LAAVARVRPTALVGLPRTGRESSRRFADGRNVSEIKPVYGLPGEDAGDEREDVARRVLPVPLLILFVGLAVATIWFVARPALDESPPAAPPCEKVVVSGSGSARCADRPTPGSPAATEGPG
jgi:hypothetical protein